MSLTYAMKLQGATNRVLQYWADRVVFWRTSITEVFNCNEPFSRGHFNAALKSGIFLRTHFAGLALTKVMNIQKVMSNCNQLKLIKLKEVWEKNNLLMIL